MYCVIFNRIWVFVPGNRKLAHPSRSPMALGSIQQGRHLRKDSKSPNFPYHCRRYGFKTIAIKVLETSIVSEILGRNFQLGSFAVNTVFPGGTAMVKGVGLISQSTVEQFHSLLETSCRLPLHYPYISAGKLARHLEVRAQLRISPLLEHAGINRKVIG